ncbi:MAG: hypothetical protein NZ876_20585 [Dehalococcoidia bacterium]|nr:hypothetical protein [Dehalococcoidia bacterium]
MAVQHFKYQKTLAGFSIDYDPAKAFYIKHRPFIFQVSLGEMDLEDAFWVELGPEYVNFGLGDFLDIAFPRSKRQQSKIRSMLDVKENPDLTDMYDALLEIFAEWRDGKCSLNFFINQGPEIKPTDRLDGHLGLMRSPEHQVAETAVFDLVIDQNLDVLDYLTTAGYIKNKQTSIEFMQANILMYFLEKHNYKLSVAPIDDIDRKLSSIASKLQSVNLITASDTEPIFEISEEGRQAIGRTIAETESYIDQYDVFKDVYHDAASGAIEFDTGRGQDLRVQVYEFEELDPVRVIFLLRLYDGSFDEDLATWRESIHSDEFFGEVLSPITNGVRIDEDMIESVIEAGYNFAEVRLDTAAEIESQEELLRRIERK